jgi:hypothetical protein
VNKYGTARHSTNDNITQRIYLAFWITTATDTHPECVILIGISWQQWLHEHTSLLHLNEQRLSCGTLFVSWRSVTVDNFFTSAVLAKELFKKAQQYEVQCAPAIRDPTGIFLHSKREEYSSIFRFTDNMIHISYCQGREKERQKEKCDPAIQRFMVITQVK